MNKRIGKSTLRFESPPSIVGYAAVAGKKEEEGLLGGLYDYVNQDTTFGEKTWEKAESRMQKEALSRALNKAGITPDHIDCIFAGDLLNQCIGSTFGLREFEIPFLGLFGACSTMAESVLLASMAVDGGYAKIAAGVTSSHFCTAERQFRTPLEYGGQRCATAQWTVTASGAVILSGQGAGPYVRHATIGRIVDMGVCEVSNMGAAMAPAAFSTIYEFFSDTGLTPDNFDLIVTGDLGNVGKEIVRELFLNEGVDLNDIYNDCGCMVYDIEKQDVHAGGSGCGCSAAVLCTQILPDIKTKKLSEVLFVGTGALMSPTSAQQGQSIPGIAHLIHISAYSG